MSPTVQITPFDPLIVWFVELKELLLASLGLSNDAMHINVGMVLFLAMVLVFRGRGGAWLPVIILTAMSLVAEVLDILSLLTVRANFTYAESARDIACTLFWPLVLTVLLNRSRRCDLAAQNDSEAPGSTP